uniref:Uncharacterized protein n=1 Tax=Rhizophora mucronata TaxID=61149 RepID=A0A2P2KSB2_RHIMU
MNHCKLNTFFFLTSWQLNKLRKQNELPILECRVGASLQLSCSGCLHQVP